MKTKLTLLFMSIVLATAMAACGGNQTSSAETTILPGTPATSAAGDASEATAPASEAAEERTFTLEELAQFDGKDGNPAYVAVNGIVYDVTDNPEWVNGEHRQGITAGADRTQEITELSPHGLSVLENLPRVGTLSE